MRLAGNVLTTQHSNLNAATAELVLCCPDFNKAAAAAATAFGPRHENFERLLDRDHANQWDAPVMGTAML